MTTTKTKEIEELDSVVIRFAGDSGDGMQLTGSQFSVTSAFLGNELATFPDFPAEIRAPQGTTAGVSGFQLQIGKIEVYTPGDEADVLVAMNPAALKSNMVNIIKGGTIIVDEDSFERRDLDKAGYKYNPLEDDSLDEFNVIKAPITSLTKAALKDSGLDNKSILRSKNMFALGMMYWLFNRSMEQTVGFFEDKFKGKDSVIDANKKTLYAGYFYAETVEAFTTSYKVSTAKIEAGRYRTANGNTCLAWGLMAAAEKLGDQLFIGSYPITPASEILHELAKHKQLGVVSFQAEDEISAICASIGASYCGNLAVTTSSGPGIALKTEAIGLAVMTELPLVIVDVQRAGPSTGMPTKTEQTDLFQALYGRNGESPVVVIATSTPVNCFRFAYEAAKIAIEHMTPVMLLSDSYLANGAEPWKIPEMKDLPEIKPTKVPKPEGFEPYSRDPETLARPRVIPGMAGYEHRIGGLEKDDGSGNVSYDTDNHEKMVKIRAEKVKRIENFIPEQKVYGDKEGDLLVIGWGSTSGSLYAAIKDLTSNGHKVSWAQFNYINPLPKNTEAIFKKFKNILVCELNTGQFANYLRGTYPDHNYIQYNKIKGMPFTVAELKEEIIKRSK